MISKKYFYGKRKDYYYCDEPEKIENYDLAISDTERTWMCHHKLEEFYTAKELKDMGRYYHVPPEELIFVRDQKEHLSLPHKGRENQILKVSGTKVSDETKRKKSEAMKGKHWKLIDGVRTYY